MLMIEHLREIFGRDAENRFEWSGRLSRTGSRPTLIRKLASIIYIFLAKKYQLWIYSGLERSMH